MSIIKTSYRVPKCHSHLHRPEYQKRFSKLALRFYNWAAAAAAAAAEASASAL